MIKILAFALICAIIIVYLKSINSELSLLASICAGCVLLFFLLDYLREILSFFNQLINISGIDKELYVIIFKITSIGYIVEFGSSTLQDFGLKSMADKLVFAGKIIVLYISLPIIYAVFNLITGLLK